MDIDIDFDNVLESVECSVSSVERDGIPHKNVKFSRRFNTTVADLWDAVTSAKRVPLWFLPLSGELREGGNYKLEGNASGTILQCTPPKFYSLTWEFGETMSWVDVTITAESTDNVVITVEHIGPANDHWEKYGSGATGVGWFTGLVGLVYHMNGYDFHGEGSDFDLGAFFQDPATQAFVTKCSKIWAEADIKSGEDREHAEAAAQRTANFYLGIEE